MSSDDKEDNTTPPTQGPGSVSGSASGSGSHWTASLKFLRQYIPTYGSKPEEDGGMVDPDPGNHQVTDYREGERQDVHGNTVQFSPDQQQQEQRTQTPTSAEQWTQEPKQQQQQNQQKLQNQSQQEQQWRPLSPPSRQQQQQQQREGNFAQDTANKAIATISKAVNKTKRNLVLPDYYDQFPDVRPSLLLTVPVGQSDMTMLTQTGGAGGVVSLSGSATPLSLTGRVTMMFKSAASAIG
ncbi:hypothetical protein BGZ47_001912, partial [Haplosporangium gracile]